jgi:uncharacterized membrane protein
MGFFEVALLIATFLCALVAGFLFAFAVVIMPGIRRLGDREFIRAFQVIDGVIQRNQPLFMAVWLGSVVALVAAVSGVGQLDTPGRALLIAATAAYLLGVQLPTVVVNVPLNNGLQALDAHTPDGTALAAAREAFEVRWNRWNRIRTLVACLVTVLLLVLLFRF